MGPPPFLYGSILPRRLDETGDARVNHGLVRAHCRRCRIETKPKEKIMLWAISCVDKPNTAAIREKHLAAHREHLTSSKGILVLAGATQNDAGTEAIGSLFIVNVNSREEAKKFSDGDAFTQNGVFASITITRMRKGQWNPEACEGA
jgi:uncharacterized protein YciI